MEIIRRLNDLCNILDQEDLLLLENHSLDKKYEVRTGNPRKKVTRLALLISLLHKYPAKKINDIIKEYIKELPNEILEFDEYWYNALLMCVSLNYLETMKILLKYDTACQCNTATQYAYLYHNLNVLILLIEHDANVNIKSLKDPSMFFIRVNEIVDNITLLNVKN